MRKVLLPINMPLPLSNAAAAAQAPLHVGAGSRLSAAELCWLIMAALLQLRCVSCGQHGSQHGSIAINNNYPRTAAGSAQLAVLHAEAPHHMTVTKGPACSSMYCFAGFCLAFVAFSRH
jgi:hypothetical protein